MGGKDLKGTPVSEEACAIGLGFANVFEMRRWQTDLGHRCQELEYELKKANGQIDGLMWHGCCVF